MGYIKTLNTGYTIGDLKEFSQYISQFLFFFFANIFQKVGVFQKVINWGNWLSYILDRFYFWSLSFSCRSLIFSISFGQGLQRPIWLYKQALFPILCWE